MSTELLHTVLHGTATARAQAVQQRCDGDTECAKHGQSTPILLHAEQMTKQGGSAFLNARTQATDGFGAVRRPARPPAQSLRSRMSSSPSPRGQSSSKRQGAAPARGAATRRKACSYAAATSAKAVGAAGAPGASGCTSLARAR